MWHTLVLRETFLCKIKFQVKVEEHYTEGHRGGTERHRVEEKENDVTGFKRNIIIMISIIVAVSDDWGIGKDNELLWHISEDLQRFKRLTTGKTVIMGKKTWYSLQKDHCPEGRILC